MWKLAIAALRVIPWGKLISLLGIVVKFLNWKKWKKRFKDLKDRQELDDQTDAAEDAIREEGDDVQQPDKGGGDDLLNSDDWNKQSR